MKTLSLMSDFNMKAYIIEHFLHKKSVYELILALASFSP